MRPHHAYLFASRRANRVKVLVHDGIGVWLAARCLNAGRFVWPRDVTGALSLSRTQFNALVGEDMAEKLDDQPGLSTVERHIRGKRVCQCCEQIVQAPVAPHIIDKGLPTTGLLAQVLVAKCLDHLPLYRQEAVFERAGHAISRSTLTQWIGECGVPLQSLLDALTAELLSQPVLHADERPVAKLNGLDPYAYGRDVMERLPTQFASRIGELLPHRWTPVTLAN